MTIFSTNGLVRTCLGLLFLVPAVASAGLSLEYEVVEQTFDSKLERVEGKQKRSPQNKTERYTETVVLGDRKYSVSSRNETTVYDFAAKTITTFRLSDRTYSRRSLYLVVGFRHAEFANRRFLGSVMSQAGVDGNPMAQLPTEHLFSMLSSPGQPTKIESSSDGAWQRHGTEAMPLVRVQPGRKIGKQQMSQFVQYLRYRLGGHPSVLDRLQQDRRLPKHMEFYRYNLNRTVFTYRLVETKTGDPGFPDPGKFTEVASSEKPHDIEQLVFEARKRRPSVASHANSLLQDAEREYRGKRYLDSMLAYLEFSLVTGGDLPASFQEKKQDITSDKHVKQLLGNLSPKSKVEAEQAVKMLAGLKQHSRDRKHVIGIFEGNIRGNLGEHDRSQELLMGAIQSNPLIAGAYKDLGDQFYGAYRADLAWLCWDFGRELAPTHRLLSHVTDFEKKLEQNYPAFFL